MENSTNETLRPTVSVIVPVRNDAKRLQALLVSLSVNLDLSDVTVVDNGSVDDSAEVARRMGARVLVRPNLRVGGLRNAGVRESTGEILAFADADHEVAPDWIATGCRLLLSDAKTIAVGSHCFAPMDGTWVQKTWELHRLRGESSVEVDWLGAGNLFVRRKDFDSVDGFREDLVAAEDVDLCYRLAESQGRIVCDKSIVSIHHGEPKTLYDFYKKELWRGSSGLKAFISHGCPLRDVPSFAWPVWHLLFAILFLGVVVFNVFRPSLSGFAWCVGVLVLLFLPSICLSISVAGRTGNPLTMVRLGILYFTYGLARAAALFR